MTTVLTSSSAEILWSRSNNPPLRARLDINNETGHRSSVRVPNVIVMVGLPARGKTYISQKLCRYLNWIGIKTKAFNVGAYRRRVISPKETQYDFFDPNNEEAVKIRNHLAQVALDELRDYLNSGEGEVAIFDATNTTRDRRSDVMESCTRFRVFFIESICDDPHIIETNIQDVKVNSPDYQDMDKDVAKEDFLKRISHYCERYEPLDNKQEEHLSFIKVINAGSSYFVHNIAGHVQSRVVYFLMNIHLMPRSIYLARHGESAYNQMGRLGGDSPLSNNGLLFADELENYFSNEDVPDLRVWTSQKIRAVQTSLPLTPLASHVEYWRALDEVDAGVCEGYTYEENSRRYPQLFKQRDDDKYHFRYPCGESYEDMVARLEPVIMELERQANVLVISHQAVLRCILAYFLDKKNKEEMPYMRVDLHTILKLTPIAYGCKIEIIDTGISAVDTYRSKPTGCCSCRH